MNLRVSDIPTLPGSVQDQSTNTASKTARPSRWKWVIFGVLALLLLAVVAYRLTATTPAAIKPVPPVTVGQVSRKTVIVSEHTVGTVVANATVQVTSQVSGQILSAAFKEGDIVRKGNTLFQIDSRPFQAALLQAQGNQARDQATLISDQKDAVRYTALQKLGAVASQQTDQAVAAAKAMQATVVADRAAADAAKLNLIYSTVKSPVDGKTGPILIQPGNLVTAGATTALVTIAQIHPVKISFFLPQTDLPRIQERMAQHDMNATVRLQGQDGKTLTAPVDFVGNAVSAQTGTIELRATFPNLDNVLVPGQLANTSVSLAQINNALVVPHDAVNLGPDSSYLWVIDNQSKAHLRKITVLNDDGTEAAISGNVNPGDRVITDGALSVVQGQQVAVKASAAGSQPQSSQGAAGAQ